MIRDILEIDFANTDHAARDEPFQLPFAFPHEAKEADCAPGSGGCLVSARMPALVGEFVAGKTG